MAERPQAPERLSAERLTALKERSEVAVYGPAWFGFFDDMAKVWEHIAAQDAEVDALTEERDRLRDVVAALVDQAVERERA